MNNGADFMSSYQHILGVFSPYLSSQHALIKALILADKSKSKLTLIQLTTPKFNFMKSTNNSTDMQPLAENEDLIFQYQNLGLEIEIKEVKSNSVSTEVLAEVEQAQYDLVIVNYKHHHPIFHEFFFAEEWSLLRQKQISVMLVGDKQWQHEGNILTAIETDDTSEQHINFNKKLLDDSEEIASLLDNNIHLINCFHNNNLSMEVSISNSTVNHRDTKAQHWLDLIDSAQDYDLEDEQLHLIEGLPDHIIPTIAEQYHVNMVIVGASEHQGWLSQLKGHTSEQIIDQLHCDILAIKPTL
ncbi:UspA domain protein [Shewanella woodyi ATCC 51908]|uniref:UspA domain protein n=2 Tax=Shewanella woodyi TaxID=60961 RepID=B1KGK6_SHEWM|nr:UspA domain protein [Shewanella woodyi ATCC 51908]